MDCPRCTAELKRTDFGEHGFVLLDICPSCDGTWFDSGELDRLDESVWVNAEEDLEYRHAEEGRKALKCPSCEANLEPLSPKDDPELIVDRCSNCDGFWLDKDELDRIEAVIGKLHKEIRENMKIFEKPNDWSRLRWLVYCFKTFK